MRVESNEVKCFTVYDAPRLDPIVVVLQDLERGKGRLIVECYGEAWSAYWGAMGDCDLRQFLCDCSADYIATRLHHGGPKRTEAYVLRIVGVLQDALNAAPACVDCGRTDCTNERRRDPAVPSTEGR